MGGPYASDLKASWYGSPGRNTFKLFYVYVHLKNCMFYICVQINASESESVIEQYNISDTYSAHVSQYFN